MKKIYGLLLTLLLFSCTGLQERYDNFFPTLTTKEIQIQWNVDYKFPTEKKGILVITNPQTKATFQMTYEEFFVMKRAYKNWRVVEKGSPVITNITQDGKYITTTFNYFDEETTSILSGKFIVDTNYITKKDTELWIWRIVAGSGWSAFLLALLLI